MREKLYLLTFVHRSVELQRMREEVLWSLQTDHVDGHHRVVCVQLKFKEARGKWSANEFSKYELRWSLRNEIRIVRR